MSGERIVAWMATALTILNLVGMAGAIFTQSVVGVIIGAAALAISLVVALIFWSLP